MKLNKREKAKQEFKKRLREYTPILKEDQDYDYHFVLKMLRYKLERTRKHILDHGIIMDAKLVGKEIQEVIKLLERVEQDKYQQEFMKPIDKKYGRSKMVFGKPDENGSSSLSFKYKNDTPAKEKARTLASRKAYAAADQARKSDLEKAFALMAKNIWKWWD
jgi:hypothetical protein